MNDIPATEKLLDLIRKKNEGPGLTRPAVSPSQPPPKKGKSSRSRIAGIKKSLHVGVDIGHDSLRLVKSQKLSEKKWALLDCRIAPLPSGLRKISPEFLAFLKGELARFCGSHKKISLWAIISAANVTLRHLRIPKVPKNQIENTLLWTFKREFPFNEQETLLDYEVLDETIEQGNPKWVVMAYTAPVREVEAQRSLFARAGFPLTGISIAPFAVQNIFRTGWIPTPEATIACLFIGNDFSRIDIYSCGNLSMTRGIKAGISSMVEALQDALRNESPASGPVLQPDNPAAVSLEQARKVLFSLSPDSPALTPDDPGYSWTEKEKFLTIQPALDRLLRQVELTFDHYGDNGQDRVSRIYVTSAMNIYLPLIRYVGEQIDIESDILDPLVPGESEACFEGREMNCSNRIAMMPALGMALSENDHCPNLLFTAREKQRIARINRINRGIFSLLLIVTVLLGGIFLYEIGLLAKKGSDLDKLKHELQQLQPFVREADLLQTATRARQNTFSARKYSERYRGLAVIGELAALTPPQIRLLNVKAEFGAGVADKSGEAKKAAVPETAAAGKKEAAKEPSPDQSAPARMDSLSVEGIVVGNRRSLESSLAAYLVTLQDSPLFRQVTIQRSGIERVRKTDFLRFALNIRIP